MKKQNKPLVVDPSNISPVEDEHFILLIEDGHKWVEALKEEGKKNRLADKTKKIIESIHPVITIIEDDDPLIDYDLISEVEDE